jgi:hypothetical protein
LLAKHLQRGSPLDALQQFYALTRAKSTHESQREAAEE